MGFQRDAVERTKHCADIRQLAEELGVSRGALCLWKRKDEGLLSYRDAARHGHPAAADDPQIHKIRELEAKVASLEGELGWRSLEASSFKSALRKVEGGRRQSGKPGGIPRGQPDSCRVSCSRIFAIDSPPLRRGTVLAKA